MIGTPRSWQSLIFYLYTGDVAFLPLRSDPTRSRAAVEAQHAADHPADPLPCSPKSMYRLAEKVRRCVLLFAWWCR
jgi:hypothetical protein